MNPIETWAFGYALTRGYPAPGSVLSGLWLDVGKPDQRGRFVLPRFDTAILSELARSIETRDIYIEVPAPREAAVPLLPDIECMAWLIALMVSVCLKISVALAETPVRY